MKRDVGRDGLVNIASRIVSKDDDTQSASEETSKDQEKPF